MNLENTNSKKSKINIVHFGLLSAVRAFACRRTTKIVSATKRLDNLAQW